MSDTREEILLRLEALLATISGINGVYRDAGELDDSLLPAAILLDGGETITQDIPPRKNVMMREAVFAMKPQIFILLKRRDDLSNQTVNDGTAAPIGPELSAYRMLAKNAIENDPTLLGLLSANGQLLYLGCDTDMQSGSSMIGQLQLHYEFRYVLFPPRG